MKASLAHHRANVGVWKDFATNILERSKQEVTKFLLEGKFWLEIVWKTNLVANLDQLDIKNLDEELDNNIYEPINILEEVDYEIVDVLAKALFKVKPIYFVVEVSHIDYMCLEVRIKGTCMS